jgi:DNA-binding Xre family transcriptional regulator
MKWKLTELSGKYQERTGERLTYEEITQATGLSPTILTGINRNRSKRVDFGTLEKLLTFFSEALGEPLTTNDLLEYKPNA